MKPTEEQIVRLVEKACGWVDEHQPLLYPPTGQQLGGNRPHFATWFPLSLLDDVRRLSVPQLVDPPFLSDAVWLVEKGFTLTRASGLTLDRLILIPLHSMPDNLAIFAHELVHVVQYRHLGVSGFMDCYVRQLTAESQKDEPDWRAIPLERIAYTIEDEYRSGALPPGDVSPRVLAQI